MLHVHLCSMRLLHAWVSQMMMTAAVAIAPCRDRRRWAHNHGDDAAAGGRGRGGIQVSVQPAGSSQPAG